MTLKICYIFLPRHLLQLSHTAYY